MTDVVDIEGSHTDEITRPTVVLVGPPNVGKSVVFGALTKRYVTVSNYPGTTVELVDGHMDLNRVTYDVVDTPGVQSFLPSSEDERVTRDLLFERKPAITVAVGDAKNLDRLLTLALQLCEMQLPFVLCINMIDEAEALGFELHSEKLATQLGVSVVPTVAIHHRGMGQLRSRMPGAKVGEATVRYPEPIEEALEQLMPLLKEAPLTPRALGLMLLAGDETMIEWLRHAVDATTRSRIEDIRQSVRRQFEQPLAYVISEARVRRAKELALGVTQKNAQPKKKQRIIAQRLEELSIHPIWGVPMLGMILYAAYAFVGVLGADILVGLLEEDLFGHVINPVATRFVNYALPWQWTRDILVGPYGILTMALTYALALILPIVGTFFLAFGALEDSGYLPRLAVIVNRGFKKIGLNGKAVLPMVLGLGCDTMATLTTRILETPKERLIVIILLALGVPCSAQLTVIMAMLGGMSFAAVLIWATVVLGVIIFVGAMASKLLPGTGSDFVLELPPMRMPRFGNIGAKTLARIEWYLKEAVPLFILGTLILFVIDQFQWLDSLQRMAEPVLTGVLGLPKETAEAFLIGFLRRDFGAAGLYQMTQTGKLDAIQVIVAVVTITLFMPCIANFFMIIKERGLRVGIYIAAFILPFALGVGALLNWVLRLMSLPLG